MPYLRTRHKDFLPNLVRHIDVPAICELLIDMTKQENNQHHGVAEVSHKDREDLQPMSLLRQITA